MSGLQTSVNAIASNAGVKTTIQNGVTGLLAGALGLLGIASITPTVSATADLTAVNTFLTQPFGDPTGIVSVSPSLGTVSVDLAALLGTAYPGVYSGQLNGLAPNTHLLMNPVVISALTTALGQALNGWIGTAQTMLTQALSTVQVAATVPIVVNVPLVGTRSLTASVSGSLQALLAGTVPANVTGDTGLLSVLVTPLVSGLGLVVGNAVKGALGPAATIGSTVTTLTPPIVTAIGGVFTALYTNGIVTLDVNSQNDPTAGNAEPVEWASLATGRYDVAALRVGVLDVTASNNVHLYLGRGSVGTNCVIGGMRDRSGLCGSY